MQFVWQIVTQFMNWSSVVQQMTDADVPQASVILSILVALLLIGTPLLLGGIFMRWAVSVLILFQIAMPIVLDTSSWPVSISIIGGLVLALTVDELQRPYAGQANASRKRRGRRRHHQEQEEHSLGDQPLLDPLSEEALPGAPHQRVDDTSNHDNESGRLQRRREQEQEGVGADPHRVGTGRSRVLSDRAGEVIV